MRMLRMTTWVAGLAMLILMCGALRAQDISGNWQGTLQTGQGNGLRTLLKISKADNGAWKAVMYLIDQTPQPIAVTSVTVQGLNFNFTITPLDVSYTGTLNSDRTTITGNATQGGQTHVLNLEHVSADNAWAIPEPPKPMAKDANPTFDVATIKPGVPGRQGKLIGFRGRHFNAMNFDVNDLIAFAYGLHTAQIVGAPAWFMTDLYDIDGVPDVEGVPSQKQQGIMLQKLLADRFQLKFHHEQKELPVYAITVAKGGPKMTKSTAAPDGPIGFGFRGLGDLTVLNLSMKDFATWFQSSVTNRPVVDQTGLTDRYDFTLKWTPDDSQFIQFRGNSPLPPPKDDASAPPSLYTAVQEQLGLKIEATKASDDVIVIDHVDKPSAN
jgi:uncharacterized protein (TIGR03435 family)